MRDSARKQRALNSIVQEPISGRPSWMLHVMQHSHIERLANAEPGSYPFDPEGVYVKMQREIGTCLLDQYIPTNPLTMGERGFEQHEPRACRGADAVVVDDMLIDSPEAVAEHLERFVFPEIQSRIATFDEDATVLGILDRERTIQTKLDPDILKAPYGLAAFPGFRYGQYGYANYFMAYALFPEVMEKDFALSADLCLLRNQAAARAYVEGRLPPLCRLDHDMADGRGTLVDIRSLDRIWFPHFARCLQPLLEANVRLIWHCDGNLMEMVPRFLEVGIRGFQGFQYEHGMDYQKICHMKTRDGEPLNIIAGVSVTTTLPHGTPDDVRNELRWLVENGPRTGLFLGASSSIVPGTPWENLQALVDGLKYYQTHG